LPDLRLPGGERGLHPRTPVLTARRGREAALVLAIAGLTGLGLSGNANSDTGPHAGAAATCKRVTRTLVVELSRAKYPQTTLHVQVAESRYHQPRVLHIDREHTDENRDAWEPLAPTEDTDGDGTTDDRDEWPMAASKEAGRRTSMDLSPSNIAYISPHDNRGAGSTVGAALRPYCDGQAFRIKPTGRRKRVTTIVIAADHGRALHRVIRSR
jgi:hypothetical protein